MTDHEEPVLRVGGVPVHRVLLAELTELTDAILARLVADIPLYGLLPREELQGEIRVITEQNLRAFAEAFRLRRPPSQAALELLRESAIRRAEEGVPLEALLAAYHLGAAVCLEKLGARFRPEEAGDAAALGGLLLAYLQRVTATVAGSYFEERQTIVGDDQASRQSLLSALLSGGRIAEVAQQAGIRLPANYQVLGLRFGSHPDESDPNVDARIAARRKLRRLRGELERHPPGPVMSMLSVDGGVALLPDDGSAPAVVPAVVPLEKLRAAMARAGGVEVVMTVAVAAPDEVPASAALVRQLLDVARAFRRPAGVYRLDDLVLEYQLTRPSPARDRLAAMLEPLDGRADLLDTLRIYLDSGQNRRRTATRLHVHANTVDYRLRRIGQLTGLDTARPDQLPRLIAALAARDAT